MKTLKLIVLGLLTLIGLSVETNAQNFEVLTGPFLDSTNYVPPPKSPYVIDGIIPITHYKQCDQLWGNDNLGTCTSSICESGCAMTDAAILLKAKWSKR